MDPRNVMPEWLISFINSLGLYIVLFAIGYVVVTRVRNSPPRPSDHSFYARFARFFVFGPLDVDEDLISSNNGSSPSKSKRDSERSLVMNGLLLAWCTVGLLGSYLTWGVLQERIMKSVYGEEEEKFKSSTFLVFGNRIFAFTVALLVTNMTAQPRFSAPAYKFSFTSLSNVMSSWCQLEALKFVSFPTQVLAKSSKLIPVMVMGKFVANKTYALYEYIVAAVIAVGVFVFILSQKSGQDDGRTTTLSGLVILAGYLIFDSFTSQWQGHLFSEYKLSSYQMMLGVNAFSASLTLLSLLQTGDLWYGLSFLQRHPESFWHVLAFSASGATGQMFIFFTIKNFGPVVFTLIMTTRQLVSIVLSCIIYGNVIDSQGMLGIVIVFGAVAYKTYRSATKKKTAKPQAVPQSSTKDSDVENGDVEESKSLLQR